MRWQETVIAMLRQEKSAFECSIGLDDSCHVWEELKIADKDLDCTKA